MIEANLFLAITSPIWAIPAILVIAVILEGLASIIRAVRGIPENAEEGGTTGN